MENADNLGGVAPIQPLDSFIRRLLSMVTRMLLVALVALLVVGCEKEKPAPAPTQPAVDQTAADAQKAVDQATPEAEKAAADAQKTVEQTAADAQAAAEKAAADTKAAADKAAADAKKAAEDAAKGIQLPK